MRVVDPKWLRVNWRRELTALAPYFEGQGGVVRISGCPEASCGNFLKLVRSTLEADFDCLTIQIDPNDPATHTPHDIVVKLEEKLRIEPPDRRTIIRPDLTVASNIEAGRDVTIQNIEIYHNRTAFDIAEEQNSRTRALIHGIKDSLERRRIAIVLYRWADMSSNTAVWFWNNLWSSGLDQALERGLLLVWAEEAPTRVLPASEVPVDIDLLIHLPAEYDAGSRIAAADDIATLLASVTNEEVSLSRARADSLLIEWAEQPHRVLAGLSSHRLKLQYRR